jgi:hypothetical protein
MSEDEEMQEGVDINPKLKALIEKGYAAREAREDMGRRVGELVAELTEEYPGQSKTLRGVLDGHRQELLAKYETKKREALAAPPSEGKSDDGQSGEDGPGAGVSESIQGVLGEQCSDDSGDQELHEDYEGFATGSCSGSVGEG